MPRFILPPHPGPKMKIQRHDLPTYEKMGKWVAQRKFNGTHVVIWIHGDEIDIWDRRGIHLSLYKLTAGMRKCLLSLALGGKETVLCGEVLHTKAKSKITGKQMATDTIVLFDILFYENHLATITQMERLALVEGLCGKPSTLEAGAFPGATKRALVVSEHDTAKLWLAQTFTDDFDYHFDECYEEDSQDRDKYPEIEGLMLRLKDSKLRVGGSADVDWLCRCRKSKNKIYNF